MAIDLTTQARVKALYEITGAGDNTIIDLLIDAYSKEFEAYLNRETEVSARTEDHRIRQFQNQLSLNAAPVDAHTSVVYHWNRSFTDGLTLTENTDYTLDSVTGTIHFMRSMKYAPGFVRTAYTGGMGDDTADFIVNFPDIAQACDTQVAYHLQRRDSPGGNQSFQGGATTFVETLGILKGVMATLDKHRRHFI